MLLDDGQGKTRRYTVEITDLTGNMFNSPNKQEMAV